MSTASGFVWKPTGKPVSGANLIDGSISGTKIVTGDTATQGTPASKGFFDNLGPIALAALAGATAYGLWNKYGGQLFGSDEAPAGGGNGAGTQSMDGSIWTWSDIQEPSVGQDVLYTFDATPPQPNPYTFMADNGFSGYGDSSWDFGGGGWSDYG